MSLLASLAFVIAAMACVAAFRATMAQYAAVAGANIVALRSVRTAREFRFETIAVVAQPTVAKSTAGGQVVRIKPRTIAPRAIRSLTGLRAAA